MTALSDLASLAMLGWLASYFSIARLYHTEVSKRQPLRDPETGVLFFTFNPVKIFQTLRYVLFGYGESGRLRMVMAVARVSLMIGVASQIGELLLAPDLAEQVDLFVYLMRNL